MSSTKLSQLVVGRQRGFSLIEILVAVTIIAILTAIATSGFTKQQQLARDAKRISDVMNIGIALEGYRTAHGSYPPPVNNGFAVANSGTAVGELLVNEGLLNVAPKDPKPAGSTQAFLNGKTICDGYYYSKDYNFSQFAASGTLYQGKPIGNPNLNDAATGQANANYGHTLWGISFGTERGALDANNTYPNQNGVFTTQIVYGTAGTSACQSDRFFSAVFGEASPTITAP